MKYAQNLTKTLLFASSLIALLATTSVTNAQEVDSGEFSSGDEGPAPNGDSESVGGVRIEQPTYQGTGCRRETVSASLSPDQKSLSILFDSYIAEAGTSVGRQTHQLGCQINIPFTVPKGYSVQIVKMMYRGFHAIPKGAKATLQAGIRYKEFNGRETGLKRVLRAKVFEGPREDEFIVTSVMKGFPWSPCGKSFVLAAETKLKLQANFRNDDMISTIDSLDTVTTPTVYHLRWQKCRPASRIGSPDPGKGPIRKVPGQRAGEADNGPARAGRR